MNYRVRQGLPRRIKHKVLLGDEIAIVSLKGYRGAMLKPNVLSTSSTVSTVFEGFLKALEVAKTVDATVIDRLRKSLNERKLDEDSLLDALFSKPEEKP